MENVKNQMWTKCEDTKMKENKEMQIVKYLGIMYLIIGSINLGFIVNFFKVLKNI